MCQCKGGIFKRGEWLLNNNYNYIYRVLLLSAADLTVRDSPPFGALGVSLFLCL